jgi:hypothetical protein
MLNTLSDDLIADIWLQSGRTLAGRASCRKLRDKLSRRSKFVIWLCDAELPSFVETLPNATLLADSESPACKYERVERVCGQADVKAAVDAGTLDALVSNIGQMPRIGTVRMIVQALPSFSDNRIYEDFMVRLLCSPSEDHVKQGLVLAQHYSDYDCCCQRDAPPGLSSAISRILMATPALASICLLVCYGLLLQGAAQQAFVIEGFIKTLCSICQTPMALHVARLLSARQTRGSRIWEAFDAAGMKEVVAASYESLDILEAAVDSSYMMELVVELDIIRPIVQALPTMPIERSTRVYRCFKLLLDSSVAAVAAGCLSDAGFAAFVR